LKEEVDEKIIENKEARDINKNNDDKIDEAIDCNAGDVEHKDLKISKKEDKIHAKNAEMLINDTNLGDLSCVVEDDKTQSVNCDEGQKSIKKKNSITKNYVFNLIYQMVVILIPLIVTPYIARVLQPDGVG